MYKEEDKRSLKRHVISFKIINPVPCLLLSLCVEQVRDRGGVSELHQLIEDISSYREDFLEKKEEENRAAMLKREKDKQRGEEMRDAAMRSLSGEIHIMAIIIIKKLYFLSKKKEAVKAMMKSHQ